MNDLRNCALNVLRQLSAAGYTAHFVGGCVRDTLLGLEPKDFDVTTNATPEQVAAVFPDNYDFVGAHFGVSLLKFGNGMDVEVATWRTDGDYSDNRRPNSVYFTTSVQEDVLRRDFTINALLMTADGEVVDYVNGLEDLRNKVVRCVGDPDTRFMEDALRMLRAVRFCAKLDFTLEVRTHLAVMRNAELVKHVSAERVATELSRMLTSGHADQAFWLLLNTELADFVMPELLPMLSCEHRSPVWHPEGSVAKHTALLLKGLEKDCSVTLALAALLHDVAKPNCMEVLSDRNTFKGHERVGAEMTTAILRRLKFSNDVVDTVTSHVANHMKFFTARQMKTSTLVRFARTPNFDELLALARLDVGASNQNFTDVEFVERFLEEQAANVAASRLVTGKDLLEMGLVPGPHFKTLLDAVETAQLDGKVSNREEALAWISRAAGK